MNLDVERALRERLNALGPAPRAELLHVLTMPTTTAPGGSASTTGTPRHGRSPSCWSTARRTRCRERCSSGCCGKRD